jgi:hypothetical protein
MTPRSRRTRRSSPSPVALALYLCGGYRKSELTKVHGSTSVGNNMHELTYGGAHV